MNGFSNNRQQDPMSLVQPDMISQIYSNAANSPAGYPAAGAGAGQLMAPVQSQMAPAGMAPAAGVGKMQGGGPLEGGQTRNNMLDELLNTYSRHHSTGIQ